MIIWVQDVSPMLAVLAAQPLGIFLSWTLPSNRIPLPFGGGSFSLNPGPFTFKELTLILTCAASAGTPTYVLYNIIGQKYLLGEGDKLPILWCVLFAVSGQCLGYGIAGLCRRFLVRPSSMLWPSAIQYVALLRSVHDSFDEGLSEDENSHVEEGGWMTRMSRSKFFWITVSLMACYQFFPSYVAPMLSSVSILCYVAPQYRKISLLGSARQGVGLLSFTFDWSIVSQMAPIVSPLWATVNQFVGCKLYYIL
jgi:hypothetical protein